MPDKNSIYAQIKRTCMQVAGYMRQDDFNPFLWRYTELWVNEQRCIRYTVRKVAVSSFGGAPAAYTMPNPVVTNITGRVGRV